MCIEYNACNNIHYIIYNKLHLVSTFQKRSYKVFRKLRWETQQIKYLRGDKGETTLATGVLAAHGD